MVGKSADVWSNRHTARAMLRLGGRNLLAELEPLWLSLLDH
jgi:hypothetical protein